MGWEDILCNNTVSTATGKLQIFEVTNFDMARGLGTYHINVCGGGPVILEGFEIRFPDIDMSDDVGAFTGFYVQLVGSTNQEIISVAEGVKANCKAEAQFYWVGSLYLSELGSVDLVITGGDGDEVTNTNITTKYRSIDGSGYLEYFIFL